MLAPTCDPASRTKSTKSPHRCKPISVTDPTMEWRSRRRKSSIRPHTTLTLPRAPAAATYTFMDTQCRHSMRSCHSCRSSGPTPARPQCVRHWRQATCSAARHAASFLSTNTKSMVGRCHASCKETVPTPVSARKPIRNTTSTTFLHCAQPIIPLRLRTRYTTDSNWNSDRTCTQLHACLSLTRDPAVQN
jgi:hypothetical protein